MGEAAICGCSSSAYWRSPLDCDVGSILKVGQAEKCRYSARKSQVIRLLEHAGRTKFVGLVSARPPVSADAGRRTAGTQGWILPVAISMARTSVAVSSACDYGGMRVDFGSRGARSTSLGAPYLF